MRQYEVRKEEFLTDLLGEAEEGEENPKRPKFETVESEVSQLEVKENSQSGRGKQKRKLENFNSQAAIVSRPLPETKGHTGYLTFAKKIV